MMKSMNVPHAVELACKPAWLQGYASIYVYTGRHVGRLLLSGAARDDTREQLLSWNRLSFRAHLNLLNSRV